VPRQRQREPGRVVRIPLGDGFVGWGRQLRSVRVEFYDRFDAEVDAEGVDPREVVGGDVAFTVAVMDRAFRRTSTWTLLDVVPLSQQEETEVYRSFKQDPLGALSIYWENPDGSWGEDKATRVHCAGLERLAVWDPEHVADRLRDHRAGRPNRWVESLALKD
jgi:hypothetical protein